MIDAMISDPFKLRVMMVSAQGTHVPCVSISLVCVHGNVYSHPMYNVWHMLPYMYIRGL